MQRTLMQSLLLVLIFSLCSSIFAQTTVDIGNGTTSNANNGVPTPYGTSNKNFRQHFLVKADELLSANASAGIIGGMAFNVGNVNACGAMSNFRIKLKHTDQTVLTTTFEVGDYIQVFQSPTYSPVSGWNDHTFQIPFYWDGSSNLLVEIVTDQVSNTGNNASVYYTETSSQLALRHQSDSAISDGYATGTLGTARSNMRFYLDTNVNNDMAALHLFGNGFPNVNNATDYTVRVVNNSLNPVSNYTVKLMQVDGGVLALVPGVPLNRLQTEEIVIPWTPTQTGSIQVYGRVEMTADEVTLNNNTLPMTLNVLDSELLSLQIGEGTTNNASTGVPAPYGTQFQSFRQQYLVRANEILDSGGEAGNLSAIAFDVSTLNDCTPMNNYRIRLKTTESEEFTTSFEGGDYIQVFQTASFMPTVGWNIHEFAIPFYWDGTSNIIVDLLTDLSGVQGKNASSKHNNPDFYCSIRAQNNTANAENTPTGTRNKNRSNMRLFINQADINDMSAISLSGPSTPNLNSPTNYVVRVLSSCPNTISNYTVKLMDSDNNVLSTVAGLPIGNLETLDITLSWIPTELGDQQIYGVVEMQGDVYPANNQTPLKDVEVMPAGTFVAQIGEGSNANALTGVPTPYGTTYKNFRSQFLVKVEELIAQGAAEGEINSIAFNVLDIGSCGAMPNYRIRLKHTNQVVLVAAFETGDYTQVFMEDNFIPVNGWNVHSFSEPFYWDGVSNLIVDVVTGLAPANGGNASVYYSTTTFNSCVRYQHNTTNAAGYATGTVSANRSNMRFYMDVEEIGSLTGTVSSAGQPLQDVQVSIADTQWVTHTGSDGIYTFPLVHAGDYQVTAHKLGYEDVTHPVTINNGVQSVQNFSMQTATNVTVSGTIVGNEDITLGLENAVITLSGSQTFSDTTDAQGQFSMVVLTGNSYNYSITKDGYQLKTGNINISYIDYDMGTIILNEVTMIPGYVLAEIDENETSVNLVWSPPSDGVGAVYYDFEYDDAGWIASSSFGGVGDWEYSNSYNVANFVYNYEGALVAPPPTAYSGTGMWGTKIHTNYNNTDGYSFLSKTFDLSGLSNTVLRFMSWENVFGGNDFCQITVNGNSAWGPSWDYANTQWRERIVDLSAYDGMDEVTVRFEMFASPVVNYAGWYIDDFEIGTTRQFSLPEVSDLSLPTPYAGLSEIEAAKQAESSASLSSREVRFARPASGDNSEASRGIVGYKVWRLHSGEELNENSWELITPTTVTDTNYSDTAWLSQPDGFYKWAVKTVYTNEVLSNPRLSNTVRLEPNELSALQVSGNPTPNVNSEVSYTVTIKNTGTLSKAAGSYTVKLLQDNTELASVTGPAIAVDEEVEVTLSWTPTEIGVISIRGLVILPGDTNDSNDYTPSIIISVIEEGLIALQFGSDTTANTEISDPTPYGTFYKSFRQQYLYTASEITALGGENGIIAALAFNVQDMSLCSPMPNYRIRMKHTHLNSLAAAFEPGVYTEVYQHDNYMPENGWNVHVFDQPFVWNGENNVVVDIVTDLMPGIFSFNAMTYYSTTTFNSSLRFQSDTTIAEEGVAGTTSLKRSNTRFFMMTDDMGSLTGTVTENGQPVPNMHIKVEETLFYTTTDQNGTYSFPFIPVGNRTVTASKNGYTSVSHTILITEDQQTIQDFVVVGIPEFTLNETVWNFGNVTLGGNKRKNFTITNKGGGELVIQSIVHSGSEDFMLTQPNLPITLRTDQTLNLPLVFTPSELGEVSATFTITDDQNNRYLITGSNSPTLGKATDTQISRDVNSIALSGNGVEDINIGSGSQNARLPLDFNSKTSLFQTIFSNDEMNDFVGMITGIKLYNNFSSDLSNKAIKIWLGSTTLNDLSLGWISSNDMTLVFNGNVDFPSGINTIDIPFPEEFMFLDNANLVMMVQRPMDTDNYSSSDFFKCQSIGLTRSRNISSDYGSFNPASMTGGTLSGQHPKITFEVRPGGVGHIEGIVRGINGAPISGASINVAQRFSSTTDANGMFHINNLLPFDYQVSASRYGYLTQTEEITIEDGVTTQMDITLLEIPKVSVLGTIIASDTGMGIEGASLSLAGYANYLATSNAAGEFIIDSDVYIGHSYDYNLTAAGYSAQTGTIEVGDSNYNMGTITMNELAFAPTQVEAEISQNLISVNISWNAPDPDAVEITESFESATFPPTDWSQTITNNGIPNMYGISPTWCSFGTVDGISPTDGMKQAGVAWTEAHQDEWLFSPSFSCPPDAYLRFDTYLEMGSDGGDHYYVKVSNNGGVSWQILWDGAAQPAGLNNYDAPITIDLSQFGGQLIKLAWHADDGIEAFGLWYNWFIDNVYIGNFVRSEQLSVFGTKGVTLSASNSETTLRGESIEQTNITLREKAPENHSRAITGYKVWRLRSGQEGNENSWTLLTDETLTETGFIDLGWSALTTGEYAWAIRAIYTADVVSLPVFSNSLTKEIINGTISGFVRRGDNNQAIAGATVSAGDYSTTATATGFYNITLPAGNYSVTASHDEFDSITQENVTVMPDENTTLNFIMTPTSNEDVVEIKVTALSANYPNPFNPETTISYDIKDPAKVRLDIFNLKGQLVRTLVNDQQASGRYNVVFTAKDDRGNKLSSGIYFYRLKAGDYTKTRKMMLME